MTNYLVLHKFVNYQFNQIRRISSATTSITRPHRLLYTREYPVVVVLPDGSSINIRYPEPRQIITVSLFVFRWMVE